MARIPAFQAGYVGSIPITCSKAPKAVVFGALLFTSSLFTQLAFVALEANRKHNLRMVSVLLFCAIQNLIVLIQKATTEI